MPSRVHIIQRTALHIVIPVALPDHALSIRHSSHTAPWVIGVVAGPVGEALIGQMPPVLVVSPPALPLFLSFPSLPLFLSLLEA